MLTAATNKTCLHRSMVQALSRSVVDRDALRLEDARIAGRREQHEEVVGPVRGAGERAESRDPGVVDRKPRSGGDGGGAAHHRGPCPALSTGAGIHGAATKRM